MSKVWKLGVVGCGGIAPTHIWAINQLEGLSVLSAVCDIDITRAEKMASEYGVKAYSSVDEMLDAGEVDAVIVTTPHMYHDAPAITALKRGIPTLVEKPLAATTVQADSMIEAARQSGALLAVCSQRQFMEPVQEVIQALKDGRLGRPTECDIRMNGYRSNAYYDHPWKGKMDKEGGAAIINQGVHPIAMAIAWMGKPKRVFARLANLSHPEIDTEDRADILVEYENGGLGTFLFTNNQKEGYYCGGTLTDVNGYNVEVQTDESMFVAGPGETPPPPFVPRLNRWHVKMPGLNDNIPAERAKADTMRAEILRELNLKHEEAFRLIGPPTMGYHVHALKNFFLALNGEEEICVSLEQGLWAVEVIEAASRSSEEGRWIDLPHSRRSHEEELKGRKKAIRRIDN